MAAATEALTLGELGKASLDQLLLLGRDLADGVDLLHTLSLSKARAGRAKNKRKNQ